MRQSIAWFRLLASVFLVVVASGFSRAQNSPRTIHVFVALADNQNQGIVPVPARLGNGLDPIHNLYWGSAYGIKTFFSRSADWALVSVAGGGSNVVAYVGHDGLMDFHLPLVPQKKNDIHRDAIILACASKQYFAGPLRASGAYPLLWTTGLMAPEAYTHE